MLIRPMRGLAAVVALAAPAYAADPLPPEELSVKASIDPGANIFVYQESLDGPGTIAVFGADDLAMKGTMPSGAFGTMLVDPSGAKAYALSTFVKRYAYGPKETVLQIYDVPTLTPTSEVILPDKGAMALSYAALLQQSADGSLIFAQNATPASSISVVDLKTGSFAQEIPTPGCWGIYPAASGNRFTTVCGDGSLMTYSPSADGKTATDKTTPGIFDPDADPVFATGARDDKGLIFVTFKGDVIHVDDSGEAPKLADRFSMVAGVEGGWAPSGYNLVAYSPALKLLFVQMHSGAYEGSHKNPSAEIWAVSLEKKAVVGRASHEGAMSLTVAPGETPALYTLQADMKLIRHEMDLSAGLALKPAGEVPLVGYPFLATATP